MGSHRQVRRNNIAEKAQWVKVLAAQPEFSSQGPRGKKREFIPAAGPLTLTCAQWCVHSTTSHLPQTNKGKKKEIKALFASGRHAISFLHHRPDPSH